MWLPDKLAAQAARFAADPGAGARALRGRGDRRGRPRAAHPHGRDGGTGRGGDAALPAGGDPGRRQRRRRHPRASSTRWAASTSRSPRPPTGTCTTASRGAPRSASCRACCCAIACTAPTCTRTSRAPRGRCSRPTRKAFAEEPDAAPAARPRVRRPARDAGGLLPRAGPTRVRPRARPARPRARPVAGRALPRLPAAAPAAERRPREHGSLRVLPGTRRAARRHPGAAVPARAGGARPPHAPADLRDRAPRRGRHARRCARRSPDEGITWHALRYHRRPSLPATLYDIARGVLARLPPGAAPRDRARCTRARTWAPPSRCRLRALLGLPFVFDVRGLLPDEYADAGHWRRGGLKYRLGKAMERVFFRRAAALVVLTETVRADLSAAGGPARRARSRRRDRDPLLRRPRPVALGRAGARHAAQRPRVGRPPRRRLRRQAGNVVSRRGHGAVLRARAPAGPAVLPAGADARARRSRCGDALAAEGVPGARSTSARYRPPRSRPCCTTADAGLSLIKPCLSKRSSSPTKVGEYLAAGLPVVSTAGIGDCDRQLADGRGVLLPSLDDARLRRGRARSRRPPRRSRHAPPVPRLRRGRAVARAHGRPAVRVRLRALLGPPGTRT